MVPALSPRPDLRQIKRQAKELLKACKAGDASACAKLRLVPRLARMTDQEILNADVGLQEAQHALAKDCGFATWDELRAEVAARSGPEAAATPARIRIPRPAGEPVDLEALGIKYGFRQDPMKWVENDVSVQGAIVRKQVFRQAKSGDDEAIQKRIEEMLAGQHADGRFDDDEKATVKRMGDLCRIGCPPTHEKVQLAARWLVAHLAQMEAGSRGQVQIAAALCLTGHQDHPAIQGILTWCRQAAKKELVGDIAGHCPWTLTGLLAHLWDCRTVAGMEAPLKIMLDTFHELVTAAGLMCFVDTLDLLPVIGHADCPHGRELVVRMLPMILRDQRPDGGWRDRTLPFLRALVDHGLLKPLRALPALPPDWRIVRTLQLPDRDLYGLTWGSGALWVCDRAKSEVLAISPADGRTIRTLPLPKGRGQEIGWWEGLLVHTQGVPEPEERQPGSHRLLLIDPETGKVQREHSLEWIPRITSATQVHDEQYGDKLWLCDPGFGCLYYFDPRTGEHDHGPNISGTNVKRVFPADQGVWHDGWAQPMLVKSDMNGLRLLDYGDRPFEGPMDYFSVPGPGYCDGLVWDGKALWALDARNKRLCVIEKTESGRDSAQRT